MEDERIEIDRDTLHETLTDESGRDLSGMAAVNVAHGGRIEILARVEKDSSF